MKWEYKQEFLKLSEIEPTLNKYGEEGWELVSCTTADWCYVCILKREIRE